jgi:hypothetical protein
LIKEVEKLLRDKKGPNINGVVKLAEDLNLPKEAFTKMMDDMKNFFNDLIRQILLNMNMPAAEVDKAAASM